jgi:hypothetical protein
MKITTVNVVMFSMGAVLLYCGIKAYDPRDVIQWGLGGKKPKSFATKDSDDLGKPQDKPPELGGPDYPGDQGLPDPDDEGNVDT